MLGRWQVTGRLAQMQQTSSAQATRSPRTKMPLMIISLAQQNPGPPAVFAAKAAMMATKTG